MNRLIQRLRDPEFETVSFDVFDTLLARILDSPEAVFYEVGIRALALNLIDCPPEAFARLRYTAEKLARTNANGAEVTLEQIYGEVQRLLFGKVEVTSLQKLEEDCERECLVAIPSSVEMLSTAREHFSNVLFISDMYLSHDFIESVLREQGLFQDGDGLFVSSSYGIQKVDGRLFAHIASTNHLERKRWLHIGDSFASDVISAKKERIVGYHFNEIQPSSGEQYLSQVSSRHPLAGRLMGCAKQARLRGYESTRSQKQCAIWESGANVAGPFLVLFGLWVIEQAKLRGITQLCFLARDAWFPMVAVGRILESQGQDSISIHYLHGSRGTYLALGVQDLNNEGWDKLTHHGGEPITSISGLCDAFMLAEDELLPLLNPLGFSSEDSSRKLTESEIGTIKAAAIEEGPLKEGLELALTNHRANFEQYLEEKDFDFTLSTALIDTGWTTRSHAPLFDFLTAKGCDALALFYIAVLVPKPSIPEESLEAFLFDETKRQGSRHWNMYFPRPFETLLFADHGRTLRFEIQFGKAVPILSKCENEEFINQYFATYSEGISCFLDEILRMPIRRSELSSLPIIAEGLIARFWLQPTKEEAQVWSSLQWEWDPQGRVRYPLARPFLLTDSRAALSQKTLPECHPQFWIAGSEALTPPWKAKTLRGIASISRRCHSTAKKLPAPLAGHLKKIASHIAPTAKPNY